MTWCDLCAMLRDLWGSTEIKLVLALIGLALGTWISCLAAEPGDRYADYEGDRP